MALNYTTFVSGLANMISVPITDQGYIAAVPNIICLCIGTSRTARPRPNSDPAGNRLQSLEVP